MLSRNKYSKRALSTFDIIGSFIVDLYYNHFYHEASRIHTTGNVDSITDGYKHVITAYVRSFDNPKSYSKTVIGIHKYYYTTTRFETISFSECINEIVKHFTPEEFFDTMSNKQKDTVLRMVLSNSIKMFTSEILGSGLLTSVIDDHNNVNLPTILQDKMIDILIFERERLYQQMFNVSTKTPDITVIKRVKSEMITLVQENYELATKYNTLKNKTVALITLVRDQKKEIEELTKKVSVVQPPVQPQPIMQPIVQPPVQPQPPVRPPVQPIVQPPVQPQPPVRPQPIIQPSTIAPIIDNIIHPEINPVAMDEFEPMDDEPVQLNDDMDQLNDDMDQLNDDLDNNEFWNNPELN